MKALAVLCHPNTRGFNQAIFDSIVLELNKTHNTAAIDLYREGFDPGIPQSEIQRKFSFDETVLKYNHLVAEADILVFVHPDWWGGPPALLKGFIDRVFRPGIAYDFEGGEFLSKSKVALLAGKKAAVFNTTDYKKPEGTYAPAEIWQNNIFSYCGIPDAKVHTFFDTFGSTFEARHQWILEAAKKVRVLAG